MFGKKTKENGQVGSEKQQELVRETEEIEIEDLAEKEPDKRAETEGKHAEQLADHADRKRNPFHVPLMLTGILLALLTVAFIGGTVYLQMKQKEQADQEAAAALELQEQEQKALEEAARAQAQAELERRIQEAKREGYGEGERDMLIHIQAQIESGSSIVEVLRLLYQDQLVLASGGQYHFIPRNPELKQNDYQKENLITLGNGELQYFQNGAMSSYKGIDVSKFQGKIDWKKVAEDGVTFAFIRVGYRGYGEKGVLMEDENARTNLEGANAAGIKTGVYFYTQAITKDEAVEEAKMVLDIIAPYQIDCPVVIDVEKVSKSDGRMNALDVQTRTEVVKAFCDAVAQAGYRPMIYHNLEMGALMLDIGQLEDYEKWFAYYNLEFYYPYAYQVWQYSDKGKVQGISGDVDMNIAFVPLWD